MRSKQTGGTAFLERQAIAEAPISEVTLPRFFQPTDSILAQAASPQTAPPNFTGAVVGRLIEMRQQKVPWVDFPGSANGKPVPARFCVPLASLYHRAALVLFFENADPAKPIIIGVMQANEENKNTALSEPSAIEMDGERFVYTAKKEIVLRCGKASIQLLADGSVRIRGTEVLSRASATNRIRGGNVQIN